MPNPTRMPPGQTNQQSEFPVLNRPIACEHLQVWIGAARLEEQRLLGDNAELFAAAKSTRLPSMDEGARDPDDLTRSSSIESRKVNNP
jgi:hypothetical protein